VSFPHFFQFSGSFADKKLDQYSSLTNSKVAKQNEKTNKTVKKIPTEPLIVPISNIQEQSNSQVCKVISLNSLNYLPTLSHRGLLET